MLMMDGTMMRPAGKLAQERPRRRDMSHLIEATGGVYRPSEAEIDRYRQHGIAMLRFGKMLPYPSGTNRIDLQELAAIEKPAAAWIQRRQDPVIVISSGKQHAGTKAAVKMNSKGTGFLKFSYCPKASATEVLLEPICR